VCVSFLGAPPRPPFQSHGSTADYAPAASSWCSVRPNAGTLCSSLDRVLCVVARTYSRFLAFRSRCSRLKWGFCSQLSCPSHGHPTRCHNPHGLFSDYAHLSVGPFTCVEKIYFSSTRSSLPVYELATNRFCSDPPSSSLQVPPQLLSLPVIYLMFLLFHSIFLHPLIFFILGIFYCFVACRFLFLGI